MKRFLFLSLGLLVVALSLRGSGANLQCPFEWSFFNGHCYKVFKTLKSWREAEISCRQQEEGSHLASIQSWAESAYVAKLTSHDVFLINVWIGLSDPEKRRIWKWSDGSRFLYRSWKRGEPNNFLWNEYCVELWSWSGYLSWNDQNCRSRRYFVCKFEPQDEGSTW
ncbi:C-type lectin lectoxin-Lio2-like [Pseudonaja textilis]|uniref:C-type lectin lectoxin-Lio2-like n=1 Tax=Pseudonaja textilis TaxID=8673 RepID=UPI000EAA549B|nr:C-type lectin lectoxin-Lio2-like [Pseudonaja textilis]